MGKVMVKKIKGISWTARASLIMVCTLLMSVFMYQGWYKPRMIQAQVDTITTNGNWTAPAGVTSVTGECWGGGGAGGGTTANGRSGGGAGGQYSKKVVSVTSGSAYAVVVGAGGTGGAASGPTGGDSTFASTTVVAKGGAGGTGGASGAGGVGSTTGGIGDTVYAGGNGAAGAASTGGGGGGGAGSTGAGGNASTSALTAGTGTTVGGGAGGASPSSQGNGGSGSTFGGGGGGGYRSSSSTRNGGSGAAGRVVITYTMNFTTAGTATALATNDTTITISMPYTGDDNTNNTAKVEWQVPGGNWSSPLGTHNLTHTSSPIKDTITGLTPNTSYDVRVTYLDGDGVNTGTGAAVQTFSGSTKVTTGSISNPVAWSKKYDGTTLAMTGSTVAVPIVANRVLVVGITVDVSSSAAVADPTLVQFGGVTLTKATDNGTISGRTHSWLYYLSENAAMDGTEQPLNVTFASISNLANISVWSTAFSGVDPISPISASGSSSSTSSATTASLASAMAISAYDQPVYISSIYNQGGGSVPTYTVNSNWTSGGSNSGTEWKTEVANRNLINTGTTTDNAVTGTISISSRYAMSALSLKRYVPPPPGTTLGDGAKTVAASACSSSTNQKINGFTLVNTNTSGADTVSGLTVTTTNGASTIASMSIWDQAGVTQYFTTLNAPTSGETWTFSGGTSIPVTNSLVGYKVLVNYKPNLATGVATTAQITAYTCGDTSNFNNNTAQGALTTLNVAPTAPTTNTANATTVRWNTGGTGTTGYLLVKYPEATGKTDVTAPTDGSTYSAGGSFGVGGTVAYVDSTNSFAAGSAPGSYFYRVFGYGACYNYSTGVWTNSGNVVRFPGVTSISPNQIGQGASESVSITGMGFGAVGSTPLSVLTFSGTVPVVATNIVVVSDTQATATLSAPSSATIGTFNVTASNGTQTSITNSVITVNAPATISTVSPGVLHQGESISMTITGAGFQTGASVTFSSSGVTASNVNVTSATQLTADIAITAGAPLGPRNLTVTNPDAGSGSVTGLVTVIPSLLTTSGALSYPNDSGTSITVQATYSGDGNNNNSCVIEWGTQNGVYTNSVAATKTVYGVFTATITGLTGGGEGSGKQYYFRATFIDTDGIVGGVLNGSHATAASHLIHNSQNLDSSKWDQGWGIPGGKYGAFVCSTCHNPSTTNIKLVRTSIQSPSMENWSSNGGTSNSLDVTFLNPSINTGSDTAHATSTNSCEVCHSRTDHHRNNNPAANHQGTTDCVECHNHSVAFAPDSVGNRNCANCHTPLANSMSTDTTSYHHYVDAAAVASTTYPTTTTPADSDKSCLQCHVQHNIFRSDLNPANTIGRSANLRVDASVAPTQGTAPGTGYVNTDFVASATNGGICTSCHVNTQTKSLVQKANGTTVTHTVDKSDFTGSMHNYTTSSSFRRDGSRFLGNCSKCHNDNMTKKYQANTGDQFSNHVTNVQDILNPLGNPTAADPYNEQFCYRCHSKANDVLPGAGKQKSSDNKDWYGSRSMGNDSIDVFSAFYDNPTTAPAAKANGHTVSAYSGQHKQTVTDENLAYIAANKHIECADCHNPHHAGNANRPQASGGSPTNAIGTNSPIGGASGVTVGSWPAMPATAALWTASTLGASYTLNPSSDQEWQICMKCHSGANTSVLSWGAAGAGAWTDLALEFNPNNRSAHPVVVSLNNLAGSVGTKALTAAKMKAPWNTNVGNQTMYCTDCHSTDSTASKGPHGSAVKWMLAGTNKAWPYTSAAQNGTSTGTYYRLATYNTGDGTTNGLFCLNCHTIRPASGGNSFHTNSDTIGGQHGSNNIMACVSCHIRVPHGGKISRLLQTANTPARYRGDGNGTFAVSGSYFDSWGANTTGGIKGASVSSSSFNSSCSEHNSATGEAW